MLKKVTVEGHDSRIALSDAAAFFYLFVRSMVEHKTLHSTSWADICKNPKGNATIEMLFIGRSSHRMCELYSIL